MPAPTIDNVSSVQGTGVSGLTIPAFLVSGSDRAIFVAKGSSSPTAQQTSTVVRNAPTPESFTEDWDELRSTTHRNSGHHFVNPVTGSYSITVTFAAVEDEAEAGAASLTGVHQTTPVGAPATAMAGTGTATVDAVVEDADEELLVDHCYVFTTAMTVGADQTSRWEQESIGAFGSGGCSTQPATSGATMTWSHTSVGWLIGVIPFRSTAWVEPSGIRYVGSQQGGFAGRTSSLSVNFALTGGLSALPQDGDLVIVAYCVGSTVDRALTIQDPAAGNYTLIGTEQYQNDNFDVNLRVAYKRMGPTPDTAVVFGQTGSTADAGAYAIHVFRGVDPTTPLDVAAVAAGGINSRVANPAAITPTTAGAWVYVVGAAASAAGGTYTSSDLSGFVAGSQADTNDAQIGAGYFQWTSGAFDPAAFGAGGTSTTNDSWAAMTVALRPEATSTTFNQSVGGTLTTAGVLARQARPSKTGTLATAGALLKRTATAKAGTLTSGGALTRRPAKAFSGALTSAGALAASKVSIRAVAGTLASAGALVRQVRKTLAGTVATAGTLSRSVARSLAGTLSSSGALAAAKIALRAVAGTLTSSGALTKQERRALAGTFGMAGALAKRPAKAFTGTVATAGTLAAIKTVLVSMTGTLTLTGAFRAQGRKALTGTVSPAGALVGRAAKALVATLSPTATLTAIRTFLRTVAGTLTSSGALVRQARHVLAGTVSPAGTLAKQTRHAMVGTLTSSGALLRSKTVYRSFAGTLATVGAMARRAQKALEGTLAMSGTLSRLVGKALAAVLGLVGALVDLFIPPATLNPVAMPGDKYSVAFLSSRTGAVLSVSRTSTLLSNPGGTYADLTEA